jgi:brefeldin A-inhibited guanine nucleotide-exchange protein
MSHDEVVSDQKGDVTAGPDLPDSRELKEDPNNTNEELTSQNPSANEDSAKNIDEDPAVDNVSSVEPALPSTEDPDNTDAPTQDETNEDCVPNNHESGRSYEQTENVTGNDDRPLHSDSTDGSEEQTMETNDTGNEEIDQTTPTNDVALSIDTSERNSHPRIEISNGTTSEDFSTNVSNGTNAPESPISGINSISSPSRHLSAQSTSSTSATVDNSSLFKMTFDSIIASKEAKKNEEWKRCLQKALDVLNIHGERDADSIFDALKMTCETSTNIETKAKAIDLFGKLFDYAQFSDESEKVEFTERSIDVISDCLKFESTDPELELQVARALMHSILLMPCHGAALLKAVRQIYNVFIYSLSARNQSVAQGILTQVIGTVFRRISQSHIFKNKRGNSSSVVGSLSKLNLTQQDPKSTERLTLKNLEKLDDSMDEDRVTSAAHASSSDEDLVVKDAFLIFRTLCKLSEKPIQSDTIDMKSHPVRSKLLSLHIIHTILKEHIDIFLSHDVVIYSSNTNDHTRLINAVRHHICLTLSRNAASSIAPVFELSLEIFWLIISNLRSEFKREIPVFWDEIYFPVAEMKTSTPHQKRYLLSIIERICNDSRCIIEFYLNYDCDSSMPNICEKILDHLTKHSLSRIESTPAQRQAYSENKRNGISVYDIGKISNLVSSTMSSKCPEPEIYSLFPVELALKMTSIACTVAFLRSLYSWAQKGFITSGASRSPTKDASSLSLRNRSGTVGSNSSTGYNSRNASVVINGDLMSETEDNADQFDNLKKQKKALLEGIRQFNQKAKKGIKYLIENGFITSKEPRDIAVFLLKTDGLDKSVIGEFLGEGDEHNIAIMHAFVDEMDFTNTRFVDAMRTFLQSFRLPGEAQKIDRFMLKFAEKYILGNPDIFANADTGYVLAYSVIMLNTDLHSPQIKNRMTVDSFITNNSGIDDGKDLPREYLEQIYDEILNNEIKLHSEQHAALLAGDLTVTGSSSTIGFFGGRDLNREAYIHASKEMSNKTEKYLKNLGKRLKADESNGTYYSASNIFHVKSIFDTMWMSILAGLTPPFKEYDEEETTRMCLEGIKLAIKISCMFELEYARGSFIGALIQFAKLFQYEEMKPKSVDAVYVMLDIAVNEANGLRDSWIKILTSISQLDRLRLIAQGVDQESIPDVSTAKLVNRASIESVSTISTGFFSQFTASQTASAKFHNQHLSPLVAQLLTNTDLGTAIEKVFTNSSTFSGEGIVDFVKALAQVADEEIESSGQSNNPRTYSLQKIVDVCYHNMSRIRLEWSQLWTVMAESFNNMGCHSNPAISFFALDSLRQLSMGFFEIEELAHFKFQKAFLKPFEYVIIHNDSLEVKDMVLECINNMVLAKAVKIKSGWKTIFEVLTIAAKGNKESLVLKTYRMASWISKEYINEVRAQESFSDLVLCFTNLAKNERFQKVSLLSLDILSKLMKQTAEFSFENGKKPDNTTFVKLWFPILMGFQDIIMHGEELEVRSRALGFLFDIMNQYGAHFDEDFWDKICDDLLFKFFKNIKSHWQIEIGLYDDPEKAEVWLSTTFIQSLTSMVDLLSTYFDLLSHRLSDYLNLMSLCICQENDTIAKIGRECFTSMLVKNANKFADSQWEQIVDLFDDLFEKTTANELFLRDPLKVRKLKEDESGEISRVSVNQSNDEVNEENGEQTVKLNNAQEKSTIVLKSVLQLLMIQSLSELFEKDIFYEHIPYKHLNGLAALLFKSYDFAKQFNDDYELRVRLWNAGVIERLPNLLKQESSAAAVYINIMFRMYCDDLKTSDTEKQDSLNHIIPLCTTITERFSQFDEVNQQRNITLWRKVIIEVFQVYVELDEGDFVKHSPAMYKLTMTLLSRQLTNDLRLAIKAFLTRVGEAFMKVKEGA